MKFIKNVVFKDIVATSAPIDTLLTGFQDGSDWKPYIIRDHASMELVGFDEGHMVEGVIFDNVLLDGKKVEATNVTINEFIVNELLRERLYKIDIFTSHQSLIEKGLSQYAMNQ